MNKASANKVGARERTLERGQVVVEALLLLNEVGFEGLTLRRLATRLDVQAAALYWHFENKQDLVDAMAAAMVTSSYNQNDKEVPRDWRSILILVSHTHRRALTSYRDGAQLMAHANMRQTSLLAGLERLLKTLHDFGFSDAMALESVFAIVRYTLGCVFEEQADPARAHPKEHTAHLRETAAAFPVLAKSIAATIQKQQQNPDHMYECGLALLLDGIEHRLVAGSAPEA